MSENSQTAGVEVCASDFKRALVGGDSAFTPGVSIWTAENFDELIARFVQRPDMSGASFQEKLEGQLAEAPSGAVQLFAEVFALCLLPLSDYAPETKRRNVRHVLDIAGLPASTVPAHIDESFASKAFRGGVAFKTRRPAQLTYLIQVFSSLSRLPRPALDQIEHDPIAFRDAVEQIETTRAPSQRHALLYLFYPDHFLPVVSDNHRSLIHRAFRDRLTAPTDDLDIDLPAIEKLLVAEYGDDADLYRFPIRDQWFPTPSENDSWDADPWTRFAFWAQRLGETIDLESEERNFKLELASRLDAARLAVEQRAPEWAQTLRKSLSDGALLNTFFKVHLFNDLELEPEHIRSALLAAWSAKPDVSALDRLHADLNATPGTRSRYTPGNATALGALLFMSRNAEDFPPYRPTPLEKVRELLGISIAPTTLEGRYVELLEMCDELLERVPTILEDRLDAQGLLWSVVNLDPPESWPVSEQRAFLAWRGGAPGDDEPAPPAMTRAWFFRETTPGEQARWRSDGLVSLSASRLQLPAGASRREVQAAVDVGYTELDVAEREATVDALHQFLTLASEGDLVLAVADQEVQVGEILGAPAYETGDAGDRWLRRRVAWDTGQGAPASGIPAALLARMRTSSSMVEVTDFLDDITRLRAHEPTERPLELPSADETLANTLHVRREWLEDVIELLRDRPQLIFYGPPGTGKTFIAQHLATHLAGLNVKLVQFHPAYTYEDFFEGYRPNPSGGFSLRPGPLRRIVAAARKDPEHAYVLIIDEINRGNIAKIFGELYFLLEYRDEGVDLLYADDDAHPFTLPPNVLIIGTMNTADRSIALLDSAIRRRFAFVPLLPDEEPTSGILRSWLSRHGHDSESAVLLDRLNALIDDPDFRIGPSYLMRESVYRPGGLERAWRSSILPLLEEHHYGHLSRSEVEARYGLGALRRHNSEQPEHESDVSDVDDVEDGGGETSTS